MANVQLKPLRSSKTRTNYISPINPETKQRIKSAGKSTKKGPNNKNDKDKQNQQLNSSSNKLEEIKFFDIDHSKNNSTTANSEVNFEIDVAEILQSAQEKKPEKVFEIELRSRGIKSIRNLDTFTKVRVLDLSNNKIENIENLDKNAELRELKLYGNTIRNIENLENFRLLECLQLQYNKLSVLGHGLQALKRLKTLRLDNNYIYKIETRELTSCSQITYLDLSHNKLENITAVCYLPNLEDLRVTHNNIKVLPELHRCAKLQEVDLSNNKISDLSRLKGSPKLQILRLNNNGIMNLSSLGKLRDLQELYLSNNKLKGTKDLLVNYSETLEILDISYNNIEDFQELIKLKKITALVELTVQCNPCTNDNNYLQHLQRELDNLHIIDGVYFTKTNNTVSTPYLRPLSAATSVISSKQIESQLKVLESDISDFENSLTSNMSSFWEKMRTLPSLPQENLTPPPTSRSSQRSRIAEARQFAAEHFKEGVS